MVRGSSSSGVQPLSFSQSSGERESVTEDGLRRIFERIAAEAAEALVVTEATLERPGPRILWVNQAFTDITGYEGAEVLGKTPRILQGPDTDTTVIRRLRRQLEAGERFEGETVNYRKDGSEYINHWSIAPIREANGTVRYWVSVQRDVTEKRRLQREVVRTLDEERRRIGRDLHDSVGSEVIAAAMRLDTLAHQDAVSSDLSRRLQDIRASIVDGYDNLRRLSQGLSPVDLSEGSLTEALERLVSNSPGVQFENAVDLDTVLSDTEIDTLGNLYWIVYEAVTNAQRHAEADAIWVRVDRDGEWVRFVVEDDGVGFDVAAAQEAAWGLRVMSYRADLIRAEVEIESTVGEGTRVTCRLRV